MALSLLTMHEAPAPPPLLDGHPPLSVLRTMQSIWPLHSVAASRTIEYEAQRELPTNALMQRAGAGVARLALAIAPHARNVWVACGPGNNGGDGLEAATRLHQAGKRVSVSLLGDPTRLPPDASLALQRARAAGVAISPTPLAPQPVGAHDLAIDALLGLGSTRAPDGDLAVAVEHLLSWRGMVLCVDLPSGLAADTGQPNDAAGRRVVKGHHTLSLLTLKPGLFTGAGRDFTGEVWFDDLRVAPAVDPTAQLLCQAPAPTPRRHAQHKRSFGDVLVLGGTHGMGGAAVLAGRAAIGAGAGRVYLHLLSEADVPFDIASPELMLRDARAVAAMPLQSLTVVCGCGGGEAVHGVLPRALSQAARLVLDADALNAIAADPMLQALLEARGRRVTATVLTPHPLEAARLLDGTNASEVQGDRLRAAQTLADRYRCAVVLKGSGSVIAAPDALPLINASGNAALATAGTGDVLAGWIAGTWAQGTDAREAARRAVHEHGAAADRWAAMQGAGRPLTASHLIEALAARLA